MHYKLFTTKESLQRITCILHTLFALFFLLILSTPIALFSYEKIGNYPIEKLAIYENRALASFPCIEEYTQKNLQHFADNLLLYFSDNLPLRTHFIASYTYVREVLLMSPGPWSLTGKKGHLFLGDSLSPTVLPYLGLDTYSLEELISLELGYAGMHAYFKLQNIPYYVAIFPDKPNLYADYLPFWASWKKGTSRYTLLSQRLSRLDFVYDFLPTMQASTQELYNKIWDVYHWNGYGLNLFEKSFMHLLHEKENLILPQEPVTTVVYQKAHWPPYPLENVPFQKIVPTETLTLLSDFNWQGSIKRVQNSQSPNQKTLWIASDSYLLAPHQEFPKGFSAAVSSLSLMFEEYLHFYNLSLTPEYVEKTAKVKKPDIVLEAFVERMRGNFTHSTNAFLRILGDAYLQTPGYVLTPQYVHEQYATNTTTAPKHNSPSAQNDPKNITLPTVTSNEDGRFFLAAKIHSAQKKSFCARARNLNEQEPKLLTACANLHSGENIIHLSFLGEPHKEYAVALDSQTIQTLTFLPIPEVQQLQRH